MFYEELLSISNGQEIYELEDLETPSVMQLPDEIAEKRETAARLAKAVASLTPLEKKGLAIKGLVSV